MVIVVFSENFLCFQEYRNITHNGCLKVCNKFIYIDSCCSFFFRYFQCPQDFGLFAPIHKVVKTGKKETTKLPTSPPPQFSEDAVSLLADAVPKTSRGNSVSSPEPTPLSLSSASASAQKVCIVQGWI